MHQSPPKLPLYPHLVHPKRPTSRYCTTTRSSPRPANTNSPVAHALRRPRQASQLLPHPVGPTVKSIAKRFAPTSQAVLLLHPSISALYLPHPTRSTLPPPPSPTSNHSRSSHHRPHAINNDLLPPRHHTPTNRQNARPMGRLGKDHPLQRLPRLRLLCDIPHHRA